MNKPDGALSMGCTQMLRTLLQLCVCVATAIVSTVAAAETPPANEFRVVGYLPYYRFDKFDPDQASRLTDLILFSARPTESGMLEMSRLERAPWEAFKKFKTQHRVRISLSVVKSEAPDGGFPTLVASPALRKNFVESAVSNCLKHRLDGLDLDWEFPRGEAQENGYGLLLQELKAAFRPHGLILSIAMSSWQKTSPEGFRAVDWVHVMSYDHGQRHATYDAAVKDIEAFRSKGLPDHKIVLGVPFYGRNIENRRSTLSWQEILRRYEPDPDQDEVEGIYFNGSELIRRKTQFALESGLGGVMIWELGQDARGERSHVKTIAETVASHRAAAQPTDDSGSE